ncbi:MAG: PKD domain-containing protein [Pseudomonadota bacterium]|nr:PKD domain-containing protein [Pseudomonadota bacterium]
MERSFEVDDPAVNEITPSLVVTLASLAFPPALEQGVVKVDVTGLAAGTTVYVRTLTTGAGGQVAFPAAAPLLEVQTALATTRAGEPGEPIVNDLLTHDVLAPAGGVAAGAYEWDFQGDGLIDYSNPQSGDTTHIYAVGGVYPARVSVYDDHGLLATQAFIVSVAGPPVARPRAFPLRGEAPLTVTFFSDGVDIDGSPEYYDWDFNGDGRRDVRLLASMNTAYTYTAPGTYPATLTVEDNDGLRGTAAVMIEVLPRAEPGGPPQARAAAVPGNGGTPLTVSLIGTGSDPDGAIVQYAWDLENDGSVDFAETVRPGAAVGRLIDVGSYAAPALMDVDGDGDAELLIGNSVGQLTLYLRDGAADAPRWTLVGLVADEAGTIIDVGSYAAPRLLPRPGPGASELLVGDSAGQLSRFVNVGTAAAAVWRSAGRLATAAGSVIDVGGHAVPILWDLFRDGRTRLLVGNSDGRLDILAETAAGWELSATDYATATAIPT